MPLAGTPDTCGRGPFDTQSPSAYSRAPFYLRGNFLLERVFHLQENQTTVRRELLGGLTTFMTIAYVVVVNPRILAEAGMPVDGVLFATCISAALATLIMGLWAKIGRASVRERMVVCGVRTRCYA